jgi:uroporphyrinogen III methyltransferase/synthase
VNGLDPASGAGPSARRPLAGRRIVITRVEADASRLARRLEDLGAVPIIVPTIRIEWADPAPLDAALAGLGSYDWVIFTSRNGVKAFFRRAKTISGTKVAAIGPATAAELRAHGTEPDLIPAEHVAEGIIDALGDVRGQKILLPRADIARRTLPDTLRERGASVDDVVVYHTRAADPVRPNLDGVDAITFASPSSVKGFLDRGPVPAGAKVVCIGPITTRTAREHGLEAIEVAGDYSEDGLIAALIAALGS